MRTLANRRYEQERADADDRDLRSRTDAKRERVTEETALMELAKRLVELKDKRLERLALPEDVVEAVVFARSIQSAPALTRQLRLIRQHLRRLGRQALEARLDEAPPPKVAAPVAAPDEQTSAASVWLERLLEEGDVALEELLQQHPSADRQALRQQMRACAKGPRSNRRDSPDARLLSLLAELTDNAG
jgi:ribosome-associated protein